MNEPIQATSQTGEREEPLVSPERQMQPVPDLVDYLRDYARQKPEVAALWCFGVGFVLGWKLKPW